MRRRHVVAAVAAAVSLGLAFQLPVSAAPEDTAPSPVDQVVGSIPDIPTGAVGEFYEPPTELPDGEPGDVIRSRAIATPVLPNMHATRVMYLSTDQAGDLVPVTGVLLRPITSPLAEDSDGHAPLVSFAHGTFGLGDQCAPSKFVDLATADPRQLEYAAGDYQEYMARGISVFVTDYLGGGTPLRQEYVVGRSEGNNVLDGARAALRLDGSDDLTERSPIGLDGYSQGAQAVAWATELKSDYAPELDVRGAYIEAPPHDMVGMVDHLDGNPTGGSAFALAAVSGVSTAYPELDFEQYLNEFGAGVYERLYASCTVEELITFGTISLDDVSDPDISTMTDFRDRLAESNLGNSRPGFPALITGGGSDTIVPPEHPRSLYTDWCRFDGVDVVYSQTPGAEHLSNRLLAARGGIAWLADKLAGAPAVPGCREATVPLLG